MSSLSEFIKQSWLFPVIQSIHIIGITILVGTITLIDLHLLGWGLRRQTTDDLASRLAPWTSAGLLTVLVTGPVLFWSDLTRYLNNPAFVMKMILLAQPKVDVVLGADTVVLGALDALRQAGKARPNQFLGGIDGERAAVAELKRAGSPYKASISLASPIFGYALGRFASDWLNGKSVPQAMDILPKALTIANIAQYDRDVANPRAVYADPLRRNSYLKMYGNICFDSRDRYIDFPWSSERR